MAAGNSRMEIVFPVTTIFDVARNNQTMKQMQDSFSKNAVSIKLDLKAQTGKSLTEQLGGGEAFFNVVQQAASQAGKLTTQYALFEDASGRAIKIATQETQTFLGPTGEAITQVIQLTTQEKALAEAQKQAAAATGNATVAMTGNATATVNFRTAEKLAEQAIKESVTAMNSGTNAADKFLSKSKNMSGAQVKGAQDAAKAVLAHAEVLKGLEKTTKEYAGEYTHYIELVKNMNSAIEGTKAGANVFQSFTTRIANAIQQTIAYSFSIGLVYKAQQLLNDAVQYAIDLNTEMTKIQVLQAEGAKTPEEINVLAQSFNKLGQEMGASTLEIAKGSVEWFRQGRTVDETQRLMKASMMLSKLGAMDSADATNYLTSITNAFKISVGDTTSVVDKLIAVDNIAATSAGELATALRYTSESAALAGVEMEQLISYIGTVSTVTRQNAEMIGQAFKTMFARMTLIQGGGTDEEGWTISKVEKALTAVNIEMKEADGTFRNMGDVLEDTAAKWDTLGERERIEIAVAIGGVRQKEAFLVLMDNMDKALTYQAAQYDATGLAADRYGIYLESIQAKQGKLTASMQEFYASVVNSKMVSAFYDIAIGMVQTITQGKLLIPILVTILALMVSINLEAIKSKVIGWGNLILNNWGKNLKFIIPLLMEFKTALKITNELQGQFGYGKGITSWLQRFSYASGAATSTTIGLKAAIQGLIASAAPIAAIATPILTVMAFHQWHTRILKEEKEAYEKNTKAANDYIAALKSFPEKEAAPKEKFVDIRALEAKREKQRGFLSTEDTEELNRLYNELYALLPNLEFSFDNVGNAILGINVTMQDVTKATETYYLSAIGGEQDLIFWINERRKTIILAQKGIETGAEEKAIINQFMGFDIKDFEKWVKEIEDERKRLGGGGKGGKDVSAASEAENNIKNIISEGLNKGLDISEIEKLLTDRFATATGEVARNEGLIDSTANEYKQMWASVLYKSEPAYVEARLALEKKAGSNPELAAARWEAERDIVKQGENAWNDYYYNLANQAEIMAEKQKKIFDGFIGIISELTSIQDSWNSKIEDGEVSLIDFNDTLNAVNKQAVLLGDSFDIKTLDDFYDTASGEIDIKGMQNYINSIKETIKDSIEASNMTEEMKAVILDMLNSVSAASVSTISQVINGVRLGQQELSRFAEVAAADIWSLSEQEKIALYDINGVILATSGNTDIAIRNGLLDYDRFLADLTKRGSKYLNDFNILLGQSLKYASGGLYKPAPAPWGGGGGGGGGGATPKDPRIAELEDLIEKEEDRKEVLEDQIEQLNRQKEAIDKLIEAENWRKELIDRQIAGYQDQIDDLSRQVDLYGRQKDAIDELINAQEELKKPLEKQLDDLDKQLDDFNKIIDAKKESLQNTKDEADYLEELTNKTKKLGKTQAELALASLDDSEEGQKRRLELEEQLGADTEDLTKYTEDRKFDLQMKGIDDAQKAFENNIEAQKLLIQSQIEDINLVIDGFNLQKEAIDDLIKPLEDQKLALEDLIYPLEQQKEKIDLVIQGYDDQKRAIDALIEPIQAQTRAIDDQIEKWNEEKEVIQEVIDAIGGGGGGGGGGNLPDALNVLDLKVKEVMDKIKARFGDLMTDLGITETHMQQLVQKWIDAGDSADGAYLKAKRYIEFIQRNSGEGNYGPPTVISNPSPQHPNIPHPQEYHEGGIAIKHGDETIKGALKDSEIFAKLLKGEYVATEDQMRNFLKKTLPNIASEINMMLSEEDKALKAKGEGGGRINASNINESSRRPSSDIIKVEINGPPRRPSEELIKPITPKPYENAYRDINIEIPITVQGSLDKTILPNLERSVIKAINKSLEKRGIKRTADNFAI